MITTVALLQLPIRHKPHHLVLTSELHSTPFYRSIHSPLYLIWTHGINKGVNVVLQVNLSIKFWWFSGADNWSTSNTDVYATHLYVCEVITCFLMACLISNLSIGVLLFTYYNCKSNILRLQNIFRLFFLISYCSSKMWCLITLCLANASKFRIYSLVNVQIYNYFNHS